MKNDRRPLEEVLRNGVPMAPAIGERVLWDRVVVISSAVANSMVADAKRLRVNALNSLSIESLLFGKLTIVPKIANPT